MPTRFGQKMTGPTHLPAELQASGAVQSLPSSHFVPTGPGVYEQTPLEQAPLGKKQELGGVLQTLGLPAQVLPPLHTSLSVQLLPSLHAAARG